MARFRVNFVMTWTPCPFYPFAVPFWNGRGVLVMLNQAPSIVRGPNFRVDLHACLGSLILYICT